MRLILTAKQDIKARTGQEYVKISYIDPKSGETGDLFVPREQYVAYDLSADVIATPEKISKVEWPVEMVEVEFNQRGRVVSLK